MPRDITGTYSLPAGNPVVSGDVITSEWANDTLQDIADALTESYCIDGRTPLDGPLELISGSAVAPSLTYQAETNTGLYRIGAGQVAFTGLSNYLGRVGAALTEFVTDSFKIKNAAGTTTLLETTSALFKTLNVEISATLIKLFSTIYSFSSSAMTLAPSTSATVTSTTTTVEGSALTLNALSSGSLNSPSFAHTGALNLLQNNVTRIETGETRIIADTNWPTTLRGLTGQSYASRSSVGSAVCGHYKRTVRTSSGTHTVTNGTRMIIVELVGGGGGGGTCGSQALGPPAFGGQSCTGGGGAYCMGIITSIASSYYVTVGAGGTAGAAGGASSFGSFSAGGGAGGAAAPANQYNLTAPMGQANQFGGNGGTASGGLIMISGEDGQPGFFVNPVVGYPSYAPAPRGGASGNGWGFGGWVSYYGGGGGSNTPGYGGGGGAKTGASGSPTQTGQSGGDGIVVIWEFF